MFKSILINIMLLICMCGCEPSSNIQQSENKTDAKNVEIKSIKESPSINKQRNWQEIKQSGYINALILDWENESALPRVGTTVSFHARLMQDFAEQHNISINWIKKNNLKEMIDALINHEADLIPRQLTITKNRQKSVSFSYPLLHDNEVLIAKSPVEKVNREQKIVVSLAKSSAFIDTLKTHYSNWSITEHETSLSTEQISDALVSGEMKYSVIDETAYKVLKQYRADIDKIMYVKKNVSQAWAVSLNNTSLLNKLNEFISVHHVSKVTEHDRQLDLAAIKKQKLPLRVITRNSPETYFLWKGELMGFEYELIQEFAKQNKINFEIIVANSFQEMLDLLKQGKGDLIAAGLSRTAQRAELIKNNHFQTSKRYNRVKEQLVSHKESKPISSTKDLAGRSIVVRKTSSFWQTALALKKKHGVKIIAADELLSTESLIAMVANQEIDLTIADSNLISIEENFRTEIYTPLTFKENIPYAYIVRNNNSGLLTALNRFITKEYRQTFYNVVKNKYFKNKSQQIEYRDDRIDSTSNLSPYDDIIKQTVKKYQFDWRLIVSQMYQESRFDPLASNRTGALGLMQMMPATAKELGVKNLKEPKQAIDAGIKYLHWVRERFPKNLSIQDQIFFSLASYNAGFGHVKDAQRLAKKMGLNPGKWFNNVERAMLLLQQRKYYQGSRFGYVRGSEPVNYVRDIHQRYLSYIEITQ